MCLPAPVLMGVTLMANEIMNRRKDQQDSTPQIARNEIPAARLAGPSATGGLDPEQIKKEDETLKVSTTPKQKSDRKRVREGLKTLASVSPATSSLPSTPAQGISTTI